MLMKDFYPRTSYRTFEVRPSSVPCTYNSSGL